MPRSQQLVPAFRALTARALRASLVGASLLTLACSTQEDAPLNPNNFSLEDISAARERTEREHGSERGPSGTAAFGLVKGTYRNSVDILGVQFGYRF